MIHVHMHEFCMSQMYVLYSYTTALQCIGIIYV